MFLDTTRPIFSISSSLIISISYSVVPSAFSHKALRIISLLEELFIFVIISFSEVIQPLKIYLFFFGVGRICSSKMFPLYSVNESLKSNVFKFTAPSLKDAMSTFIDNL